MNDLLKRVEEFLEEDDWASIFNTLKSNPELCSYSCHDDSLIHFAFFKSERAVKELIAVGVSPDITDSTGATILMDYSAQGNLEMVSFLLKSGADPNLISDSTRETALSWAIVNSHLNCAKLLFEFGADVNHVLARTPKFFDIFELSKIHSNEHIVEWLAEKISRE